MIPQEVRDLAAGIADDIERLGHYEGGGMRLWASEHYALDGEVRGPGEPCCVVMNPHWAKASAFAADQLRRTIGVPSLVNWNDETPTPEVLATLRKIAAGERP